MLLGAAPLGGMPGLLFLPMALLIRSPEAVVPSGHAPVYSVKMSVMADVDDV